MDSCLCLVLLQLAVALTSGSGFQVLQPRYLEATEGGSVTLPCSFTYPGNSTPQDIDVRWRVHNYLKNYIFSSPQYYVHAEYQGRIEFLGSPLRDKTGSIRINDLREKDSNMYFCVVVIAGEQETTAGTVLSVRARTSRNGFWIEQPGYLEAAEGGSVTLPCSFTYPATFAPRDIVVSWKLGDFYGRIIFSSLKNHTSSEYQGRIEFLGSPFENKMGSIRLLQLKESDSNFYFCRVNILGERKESWQSICGTFLSVTDEPVITVIASSKTGWLFPLLGVCGVLLLCAGLAVGIWVYKRKRSENIKKEGSPSNAADEPQHYATSNVAASKDDGSEGIVYSVVQAKGRPAAARNVAHSEQKCVYADIRFGAETN
ncbi:uncharacterized protein LOC127586541 isoform X2 [Pristis pectinata]|uniref:uncharacterized protein LOC127586541 isoform X2 n=1 Tax=Pristis pectinata TaxID=685728 RepID=UPI00223E7B71|nr:uncharacterized protein LOC127586541 isoform X2 [Pristis pectinata]